MFEKCGLRDIFVRIGKLKWLILILVIIGAAVGSLMYVRDVKSYQAAVAEEKADTHKMHTGFAYFYVYGDVSGADTTSKKADTLVGSYINIFSAKATDVYVYNKLLENHSKDELGELLDSVLYKDKDPSMYSLYGNIYVLRRLPGSTVIEIRVCAETHKMCKELLTICRTKLKEIAKSMPDSKLKFEGKYYRHRFVKKDMFFKAAKIQAKAATADSEYGTETAEIEEELVEPGKGPIIIWALIGFLAGILIAIAAAVFAPTINRDSDFELYGTASFGTVRRDSAAMLSRVLMKKAADQEAVSIVAVTTLKENKKIKAFFDTLKSDIEGKATDESEEQRIRFSVAYQPVKTVEASDLSVSGDMIIAIEEKGVSRHQRFDEMKHYLELMDKKIDGAVLMA